MSWREPFFRAASSGNLIDLTRFLDKRTDPNSRVSDGTGEYGMTLLMYAAEKGHLAICRLLLDRGADVNYVRISRYGNSDYDGDTALIEAARGGHPDVVRLLLSRGAKVHPIIDLRIANSGKGKTPTVAMLSRLYTYVPEPHQFGPYIETLRLLWDAGDRQNHYMAAAACTGPIAVPLIEVLLGKGANINQSGYSSETPLDRAVKYFNSELVRFLLAHGADPNIGAPPIVLAVQNNDLDTVRLLVERGADINAHREGAFTALMFAAKRSYDSAMVRLLLDLGADPNTKGGWDQTTALIIAAEYASLEVVKLLLEHGADARAKTTTPINALYYAQKRGETEMTRLLKAARRKQLFARLPFPRRTKTA